VPQRKQLGKQPDEAMPKNTTDEMQRIAASPHLLFMCVLGPLFFRSSLYQLVLARSRCPQPPAAQSEPFCGLFGPSGRPRGPLSPNNCAKFAGAGAPPPLRRCAVP
jgi:hypothetical protein